MIKIYGVTASRAARCLWTLEELGLEYEQVQIAPRSDEARSPEYLAINPNARIPTLVDGDLVLWEAMAINLYLAEKYDGGLKPKSLEERAKACQWSFWGMLETETNLFTVLRNRRLAPEEERDPGKADEAEAALQRPLRVLEGALAGRPYLLGDAFSVADLNLASIMSWGKMARLNLDEYPASKAWLDACLERDAYQRVYAKR
jgi:glutathione S-transferase